MGKDVETIEQVVAQMKLLLQAVPGRPSPAVVEAARLAIREEDRSVTVRLGELFSQPCPSAVPATAFRAFQELHEGVIRTQSEVRRRDDSFVLQLEERHRLFDDLLRTAEQALPARPSEFPSYSKHLDELSKDDGRLRRSASSPVYDSKEAKESAQARLDLEAKQLAAEVGGPVARTHEEGRALLASQQARLGNPDAPPVSSRGKGKAVASSLVADGSVVLSPEQEEWLGARWPPNLLDILEIADQEGTQPESLNFSNGGYNWIPESIGALVNLTSLNLSGNQLTAVPDSLGELTRLTNLDLEANLLKSLPESIGDLTSLKKLNLQKNSIGEIPWTIGGCTSLEDLRADFNQLKALPEALGQLKELKYLSVHLNCLKSLPTTMSSLTSLTDLFVNFNHLDTLPESLCSLTNLTRLDASSNFAEFRHLPSRIGNLQGLRDLDLSFNHITVLPDSFALLTDLRRLNLDGNPWRTPPLDVVAEGREAVLEYMAKWKDRDLETKSKTSNWNVLAIVLNFIFKCRNPRTSAEDHFAKVTG